MIIIGIEDIIINNYIKFISMIIISIIIDLLILKKIKQKKRPKDSILGFQISILGIFLFYIVYNREFYTMYADIIPFFMSVYLIVTGVVFNIYNYINQ